MSKFNTRTVVKTRKEHHCMGCNKVIEKGTTAINNKGYFEDWYNYHLHERCEGVARKYSDLLQDGLHEGFIYMIADYYGKEVSELCADG